MMTSKKVESISMCEGIQPFFVLLGNNAIPFNDTNVQSQSLSYPHGSRIVNTQ